MSLLCNRLHCAIVQTLNVKHYVLITEKEGSHFTGFDFAMPLLKINQLLQSDGDLFPQLLIVLINR